MPKKFRFFVNDTLQFSCNLASERCVGHNKNGAQCKRATLIGSNYCWTHLRSQFHLRIKDSTIPGAGKGLFADDPTQPAGAVVFRKDDTLIGYRGEVISKQELDERYGGDYTAPYALQVNRNTCIDAACVRGVASTADASPNNTNSRFSVHHNTASLKATKNIRNGEEIFVSYGRAYRLHEEGVRHETK